MTETTTTATGQSFVVVPSRGGYSPQTVTGLYLERRELTAYGFITHGTVEIPLDQVPDVIAQLARGLADANTENKPIGWASLRFYVPRREAADDEDALGQRDNWRLDRAEDAEIIAQSDREITFRSRGVGGATYDWQAYLYDFGGEIGEDWSHGTSAELLEWARA